MGYSIKSKVYQKPNSKYEKSVKQISTYSKSKYSNVNKKNNNNKSQFTDTSIIKLNSNNITLNDKSYNNTLVKHLNNEDESSNGCDVANNSQVDADDDVMYRIEYDSADEQEFAQ